jgi:nucleoside-diphosphate-sugar epimerase
MDITIIGGSGFIGSRLCNRLNNNTVDYKIIDKKNSPFFHDKVKLADIRNRDDIIKALSGTNAVIHLAAEHRDDVTPKSLYDDVNVTGTANILQSCVELGINKIIFTSSVAVYGFAPLGTDETGEINYFNDYGRTKWEAEKILTKWQQEDPVKRSLTIVRPTVVFGERNRGNVYNLLRQIASSKFLMVGDGTNVKSMAYVENVAAFLEYCLNNPPGIHIYNYIDKPDFDMNTLVAHVKKVLGKNPRISIHWPYWLGYLGGAVFDVLAFVTGKKFSVSRIRIKKFCSNTLFEANAIKQTAFVPEVSIEEGIARTIQYEFMKPENGQDGVLFYSE